MIVKLNFTGGQVGGIYATMGLASLFMPGLLGVVADRWINAERLLGICHLIGSALLFWASTVTDPHLMYWIMLLNAMVYMPTIALNNTVSYTILKQKGLNIVKDFPPIRVWGTVGFIMAMWVVALYRVDCSVYSWPLCIFNAKLPSCKNSKETYSCLNIGT